MEKDLKSNHFLQKLTESDIPEKYKRNIENFYQSFYESLKKERMDITPYLPLFITFLKLVKEQFVSPFTFQPYHKQIRTPFDYYLWGNEFLKPLVDQENSSVNGLSHVDQIVSFLSQGHNVVLLANHQTEADPQAMSLLLEKSHPDFVANIIFVAGERVITDPLAIPFSMGRNLLCIYSKRYIDHPIKEKLKKQLHNKRTMELMSKLLKEGGKCIYMAPSGGRDRPNHRGMIEIAPFDPSSIEMFYLMAQKSKRPTRFYPLALSTYTLLPPPNIIQKELGEKRMTKLGDLHLSFGAEIDMEHFPGSEIKEKQERRKARSEYIWSLVNHNYTTIDLKL